MKQKITIFSLFLVFCIAVIGLQQISAKQEIVNPLAAPIYVNGNQITLTNSLVKDERTYVQLRELCEKINVSVEWVNPAHHYLPVPGGNLPGGINLDNPTFVYTREVTDYYQTDKKVNCVDVTGLYQKYTENKGYKYYFDTSTSEFCVVEEGKTHRTELKLNPSDGRMYLKTDEFKKVVLPYLVDICMQ